MSVFPVLRLRQRHQQPRDSERAPTRDFEIAHVVAVDLDSAAVGAADFLA